eukprot:gnl/MRDRNA2_/MRDRNA2_33828_c0_seq1.p1 gnl/MRDRNA2_/MRDRNA2_33828_c0~~gnl/MRDRNA2_/MRDRNA2_33828_c0_seq1.p1  ORF type:complete len:609 (+),score=92.34 gnl/MRDRNA2_/MRDRNA2_33828_c0_seq1:37-1863(+)
MFRSVITSSYLFRYHHQSQSIRSWSSGGRWSGRRALKCKGRMHVSNCLPGVHHVANTLSIDPRKDFPLTQKASTSSIGRGISSCREGDEGGAISQINSEFQQQLLVNARAKSPLQIDRKDFIQGLSQALASMYDYDQVAGDLGEGGYGNVFVVTHRISGQKRACKRIPNAIQREETREMVENEILTMMELDHPHICRLYEYFIDEHDGTVYLVLELMEGGDLFEHMMEVFADDDHDPPNRFSEYEAGMFLRHMLKATFCCHSANIVHRDIKPENFMFQKCNSKSDLKMIDLGLAMRGPLEKSGEGVRGTVAYMAPEIFGNIEGVIDNRKCDVWALGVIAYCMLTGEPLFTFDNTEAKSEIQNPMFVTEKLQDLQSGVLDIDLSKDAHDILRKMLNRNPSQRMSVQEALSHPFVMRTYMASQTCDHESNEILSMSDIMVKMRKFAELPLLKRSTFMVLAHMVGSSTEILHKHRLTFRRLDIDGGGSISREEFLDAIRRECKAGDTCIEIANDFDSFVWPNVDLNCSDDINFTEFLAVCLCNDGSSIFNEKDWRGAFQILDCNHSGKLDIDDLIRLFPDSDAESLHDMLRELVPDKMEMTANDFVHMMMQ